MIRYRLLFLFFPMLIPGISRAHQSPTTNILLDVNTNRIGMELQIPIPELALAFDGNILKNPASIVDDYGEALKKYINDHIYAYVNIDKPWRIDIAGMYMDKGTQVLSGPPFWELRVLLNIVPNKNEDTRKFMLHYDVVMHQVINHIAFVSVRNDWENGIVTDTTVQVGVIRRDMRTMTILPFEVNLEKGSKWKGFVSMFWLGIEHIKTGTDHLLFIITLLLPACLLVRNKKWALYGGLKYSVFRLLKIITAFTIGHSITLLIGILGFVKVPPQFIEITIAVSILVSAIHAITPLFYGKEIFIALGFGFIHGLAFSQTLQNLHLESIELALSVLGFNLGIEAMQLAVIAMTIPWFIIMSRTPYFRIVKNIFASLVSLAAMGWIGQRVTGTGNVVSEATDKLLLFSPWLILGLCLLSLACFIISTAQSPFGSVPPLPATDKDKCRHMLHLVEGYPYGPIPAEGPKMQTPADPSD
jgi:hypothetical protein